MDIDFCPLLSPGFPLKILDKNKVSVSYCNSRDIPVSGFTVLAQGKDADELWEQS